MMLHNPHLEGDSFVWEGGPVGVLLSHGYTATTAEVRLLAKGLHEQGYTVAGPLLPGHGTTPREMNRCRWQVWAGAFEQAFKSLAGRCERVFVGGESMGGLLALYVASLHPEIAGILTYAPAIKISTWTVLQAYVAAPFLPHVAKKNLKTMNKNWQGYPVNTVPGVVQMHRLQREVRRRLPQIRQPLLIIPGRLDIDIDLRGINILYHEAGSALKELHWMEKTDHLVILGRELAEVTDKTVRFMERALNQ